MYKLWLFFVIHKPFSLQMCLNGWFVGFYGISTFVGYLFKIHFYVNNLFFLKQFISTQFNGQKHFYFKLFKQLYVTIWLSVNTVLMSKTVLFQIIQLSISTQFKCHHHHVVPPAQISLTLSRHFSLSFIAFGRSSGLHPVSSHSCCMYVRAGSPAFAWPYVGGP